jgi:hypothetical protein
MSHMRALRLQVAVPVLDAADDFAAGLYPEPQPYCGIVTHALVATATAEDIYLARACLDAERYIRRRGWEALEALLGAIPPGGNLDSIYDLPPKQSVEAIYAANACHWLRPVPEGT